MWTYIQSTGQLLHDGQPHATGYSGFEEGKNNPAMQNVHDTGPIPVGVYRIGDPHGSAEHGPCVLPLTPDTANQMFGRGGFLIHGDSASHPGAASRGCMIFGRVTRDTIAASEDRLLEVAAMLAEEPDAVKEN